MSAGRQYRTRPDRDSRACPGVGRCPHARPRSHRSWPRSACRASRSRHRGIRSVGFGRCPTLFDRRADRRHPRGEVRRLGLPTANGLVAATIAWDQDENTGGQWVTMCAWVRCASRRLELGEADPRRGHDQVPERRRSRSANASKVHAGCRVGSRHEVVLFALAARLMRRVREADGSEPEAIREVRCRRGTRRPADSSYAVLTEFVRIETPEPPLESVVAHTLEYDVAGFGRPDDLLLDEDRRGGCAAPARRRRSDARRPRPARPSPRDASSRRKCSRAGR